MSRAIQSAELVDVLKLVDDLKKPVHSWQAIIQWHPDNTCPANHMIFGYKTPKPRIFTGVAIIPHGKVIILLNNLAIRLLPVYNENPALSLHLIMLIALNQVFVNRPIWCIQYNFLTLKRNYNRPKMIWIVECSRKN